MSPQPVGGIGTGFRTTQSADQKNANMNMEIGLLADKDVAVGRKILAAQRLGGYQCERAIGLLIGTINTDFMNNTADKVRLKKACILALTMMTSNKESLNFLLSMRAGFKDKDIQKFASDELLKTDAKLLIHGKIDLSPVTVSIKEWGLFNDSVKQYTFSVNWSVEKDTGIVIGNVEARIASTSGQNSPPVSISGENPESPKMSLPTAEALLRSFFMMGFISKEEIKDCLVLDKTKGVLVLNNEKMTDLLVSKMALIWHMNGIKSDNPGPRYDGDLFGQDSLKAYKEMTRIFLNSMK